MPQSSFFPKLSKTVIDKVRQAIISHHKRSGRILFSDTTLRDGEQMDLVQITKRLNNPGAVVHFPKPVSQP